jgi:hypothetical protein
VIQTFLTDGTYKAFRKGVHVGGIGNGGNALNVIFIVGEKPELTGIVMDEVRTGIAILKGGKLPAEERDSGIGGKMIYTNAEKNNIVKSRVTWMRDPKRG